MNEQQIEEVIKRIVLIKHFSSLYDCSKLETKISNHSHSVVQPNDMGTLTLGTKRFLLSSFDVQQLEAV